MPNTPQPKRGIVTRHTHPQRSLIKRIYVAALLILLPLLMTLFSMLSKKAKSETQYLRKGFALKIARGHSENLCPRFAGIGVKDGS